MALNRDDRDHLEDILARNKLGDVLAEMAVLYKAHAEDTGRDIDERALEMTKAGVVEDLAEEAGAVVARALSRIRDLVGDQAGLALAALL